MEHEDSHGHRGTIRNGDVQWMTAGAGVIHSEMPSAELRERGGRMHGFQIWVNLPKALKLTTPRYQEYSATQLPVVEGDGRWVRVIAGEFDGRRSPIETTVPTTLLHVRLNLERTQHSVARARPRSYTIDRAAPSSTALHAHDVAVIKRAPEPCSSAPATRRSTHWSSPAFRSTNRSPVTARS